MVGAAAAAAPTAGMASAAVLNSIAVQARAAIRRDAISSRLMKSSRGWDPTTNRSGRSKDRDRGERQQDRQRNLRNNWRWALGEVLAHCRRAGAARVIELGHAPRVFDRPHQAVVALGDGRADT